MLNTNFIKNESDNKILSLPNYSEFNLNNEKFSRKETSIPKKKKNKLLFISKKEGEKDSDLNKTNTFLKKKHDLKENFFLKHNLNGRWSLDEQMLFVDSALEFGSDWKKIHEKFSTRTITQIRSHAQKFLMKLKENSFLKEKGLKNDFCWSKAISHLKSRLTNDEIKNIFYSLCVENKKRKIEQNFSENKNYKKNAFYNIKEKENIQNSSMDVNNKNIDDINFNIKDYNFNFGELSNENEYNYFEGNLMHFGKEEEEEKRMNYFVPQKRYMNKLFENFNSSPLNDGTYNTSLYYNNDDNNSLMDLFSFKERNNEENELFLLE